MGARADAAKRGFPDRGVQGSSGGYLSAAWLAPRGDGSGYSMEQVWSGRWALQRGCCLFLLHPFSHPHVITDGHGMSAASREVPAPWLCCTVLPSRASLRPSAARSGAKALSWQCLTLVLNMEHPGKHQGSRGESACIPACGPAPEGCLDLAEQKTLVFKAAEEKQC